MNRLPQSWNNERLKDIAHINSSALPANTDPDYEFDYLEISNVNHYGIIDFQAIECLRYEDAPSRARRRVFKGNTVISSVRPNLQAVAFIKNDGTDLVCSIRSLYIGWLAAVTREMMDDDEMEPQSVSGLGSLTAAQQALAEFLEVDVDLLAGAGIDRPALQAEESSQKEMVAWLDELPRDEVLIILKQLLEGQGLKAERTLKNRFAAWRRGQHSDKIEAPRRTVGELRKNAVAAEKIRLEQEKRELEKREIKRRKEHAAYLKNLSENFPKAWKSIQYSVERGSGLGYDEACRALVDLSEAYSAYANRQTFEQEFRKFMAGHMRRKALIQRLVKAGIWHEK